MDFFEQNAELTISVEPLVTENEFLSKVPDSTALPEFNQIKDKLPKPTWQNHDDYISCYYQAWQIAFSNLRKGDAATGFVSDYIDTAFNGCIFMWDSAFILMFGKYADRIFEFQTTLDNFYSHQHRDGFICREIAESTGRDHFTRHDPSSTGPELLPWCEWEYYLNFGDKKRLGQIFPPLMAYHRWMAKNRTWRDGSYFSTGWGCGMDNIPRQMAGYSATFSHGHMVWVDTCMQELLACNVLMDIATEIGRTEFLEELKTERDNLENIINNKLWDEKSGFYYDLWKNGQFNMVRHIGAYWSLISNCASVDRADRMIAYLTDEKEFATPHPIPALSKSSEYYNENGNYWCGGVWAPTNYMVLKGLDKYGKHTLAHKIAKKHLENVVGVYNQTETLYENYAPKGMSKGNQAKSDFVGWTGLVPISVLFEYVFGIKPDAAHNRIVWHIELTEKHGVESYPFGTEGDITLMCEARQTADEKPQITFKSDIPLELEVRWGENTKQSMIINA